MPLAPIPLDAVRAIGHGLERPEDVVVGRDHRVWASDPASACAEILAGGGLRRVGHAGGAPNGINMDALGRILIANFGMGTGVPGPLQRLDPESGRIETLCEAIDGRTLVASNYPIVDRAGNVWVSHSTWDREKSWQGLADGFVYRVRPDGCADRMAEGFSFTNGLALDADERWLYVCQSVGRNVVRLPIRADGTLGAMEPYGPPLGEPAFPGATPAQRRAFGATDGCGFDAEGNLWVTLVVAGRIVAITPAREVVSVLEDPTGATMVWPTNVSWGGPEQRDLYIGSVRKDYVLHARSPVPGLPLAHQRWGAGVVASWDSVAAEYAQQYFDELDGKPFDREWLDGFAAGVKGRGRVADLGCGPGHVARHLAARGVATVGIDLSPSMIATARRLSPGLEFLVGDFFRLDLPDGALAGIVAFYSLIHCARTELSRALAEIHRVLEPGGRLLLAVHAGSGEIGRDEAWGKPVALVATLFSETEVRTALEAVGFRVDALTERAPYEFEHQTRRLYALATRG
jgi:gluconolactonase